MNQHFKLSGQEHENHNPLSHYQFNRRKQRKRRPERESLFSPFSPVQRPTNTLAVGLLLACAGSALAEVHYVDLNSTNATPPYTNWATAATNIQDAVDAAVDGDEVVVTNGIYQPVEVNKPLSVRSVNGPQVTVIDGRDMFRCALLNQWVSLSGFTLANGHVEAHDTSIGGAGAFFGTLNNCVLVSNVAEIYAFGDPNTFAYAISTYGGAAAFCTLNNCTLVGNKASASIADLYGFAVVSCYARGGGAYNCQLNNCTLTDNSVSATASCAYDGGCSGDYAYAEAGGAYGSELSNCISFANTNAVWGSIPGCVDCGSPGNLVGNNWYGDPRFADYAAGNLRLQSNSPCINAGNNAYAVGDSDLDGNPRIAGGTVDIGAYEHQTPVSQISYAWLQRYGLPINSSADAADPDGDAVDNYHEWLAATDPTNALSSPAQLTITPSGEPPGWIAITWSTNAVGFKLQSTADLTSPASWNTNLPVPVVIGNQNIVTNPVAAPQQFFRLISN